MSTKLAALFNRDNFTHRFMLIVFILIDDNHDRIT